MHTLGVSDVKLTGRPSGAPPDIAVALIANGAIPNVTSGNCANEIVCAAAVTLKVRVTAAGTAQFAVAAWLAVTEHCPAASSVRLTPSVPSVQTEAEFEANAIAPGEFEVAVRVIGVGLSGALLNGAKVSVGVPCPTLKPAVALPGL